MSYLEDIKIGVKRELGSFTFTADAIKDFARQFDPQPFHLDEAAGRASLFGGLAASGWHLTAVFMKLLVSTMKAERAAAEARGEKGQYGVVGLGTIVALDRVDILVTDEGLSSRGINVLSEHIDRVIVAPWPGPVFARA